MTVVLQHLGAKNHANQRSEGRAGQTGLRLSRGRTVDKGGEGYTLWPSESTV